MKQTCLHTIRLFLCLLLFLAGGRMDVLKAQEYVFRYVSTAGDFGSDGLSWATAKSNLQNAIDELYEEIRGTAKLGYVYVAGSESGMTYVPSRRSTDDADGSVFNTSFRIYAGIHVYGGFSGTETADPATDESLGQFTEELLWKKRIMTNGETYAEVESDINADLIGQTVRRWNFKYKTILSGNHSTNPFSFTFDTYRGIYATSFPLSSYHVVWFATNGRIEDQPGGLVSGEENLVGHFRPLEREATVEGCTIEGGFASSNTLQNHVHTGYGGGVYMVKNATLRNCIVHHCAATMRGGGVYMDGGGEVERCYMHTNQVSGYGMQQGYGGAVCIDYDGAVRHSYIIQSAARIGAGLAICRVPSEYPEKTLYPDPEDRSDMYDPYALATVIANCTSNAEGAGVYLNEGGTLNHCSVVNNKCVGPDVIYYGRRHGRTGGIYVRNGGTIYNTVAWGNESAVNNNVQYASFKDAESSNEISVHHSAFSKMDLTDWSSTSRKLIISLSNQNFPTAAFHDGNFPMFSQPTAAAGIQYDPVTKAVDPEATAPGEPYQRVYNWHPLSASSLRMKAVQVTDALQAVAEEVIHAHTDVDVVGRSFEPVSSIGGLARSYRNLVYALEPSLEPGEEGQLIPTIFMDPGRVVYDAMNSPTSCGYLESEPAGHSWTHPCGNLSDGITFFKNCLHEGGTEETTYYELDGVQYRHVQIVVKQGSMIAAGRGAYLSGHARTASIRPSSNMRLYGGFSSALTGTDISIRSPHLYRTSLSANVLGGEYHNNSVHVIAIANQHNVIIDGFHLYSGNSNVEDPGYVVDEETRKSYEVLADGAGIVVNNAMSADNRRIDMVGNVLRNAVIANCSAPEGSAVFVGGGYKHGTENRMCRAELTIVNTIMRNNTAGPAFADSHRFDEDNPDGIDSEWGTVTAHGNAHIWIRNSNIMNNCGYALKATVPEKPNEGALPDEAYVRGHIEIYNSVIFSNGQRIRSDRSNIYRAVSCKWEADGAITGNYIYLDHDAVKPDMPDFVKCFNYLTRYKSEDGTTGTAYGHDEPVTLHYPWFVNPSRNVGHSEGGDFPMYGGVINYEPLPTNPIVNGAYAGNGVLDSGNGLFVNPSDDFTEENLLSKSLSMGYDRELEDRHYGGDPDAGAIESVRLPIGGSVLYVTPDGAGRRDGSSWGNAIQGNAIYSHNAVAAGTDAIDAKNGARIINTTGDGSAVTGIADGVLTTDPRYCGFATAFFTDSKTGGTFSTTVQDIYTTITRNYVGGDDDGQSITDPTTGPVTETETISTGTGATVGGFTAGWYDDDRYPYGELSGASRFFWRANQSPIPDWWTKASFKSGDSQTNPYTGEIVTGIGDGGYKALLTATDESGNRLFRATNNRAEHYVGGLQYAVDIAAAYNAPSSTVPRKEGVDSIQVWVSNGKYTDYKGFVMRDNTTVMGGFPAADGGTPGLNERFALLSAEVDIPKAEASKDLEPAKYETILQISDTNPEQDKTTLNPDAVKEWDDDLAKEVTTDTKTTQTIARSVTETYTWNDREEVTSTYVLYPDCYYNSKSVFDGSNRNRLGYNGGSFWTAEANSTEYNYGSDGQIGKPYFGTGFPAGQKFVYAYFGKSDGTIWTTHWNSDDYNKSWEIAYPDRGEHNLYYNSYRFDNVRDVVDADGIVIGTTQYGLELKGALYGTHLWQTMKEVPAGDYVLEIDLAAYYQNNGDPSGVTFYIFDSQGTKVVTEPITYKSATTPRKLKRYAFEFTQAVQGDLSILLDMDYADTDGTVANNNNVASSVAKRDVLMDNVHLYKLLDSPAYVLTGTSSSDVVTSTESPVVTTQTTYTVTKHRLTLRKRVLQMPDESNPVFGGGRGLDYVWLHNGVSKVWVDAVAGGDDFAHCERVNLASRSSNNNSNRRIDDPDYKGYNDVIWDGFTIRHGFLSDVNMAHGGGAGVCMFEGAHLRNCIVINNYAGAVRMKGSGIFCDGSTATIEGCFVLNNTATRGSYGSENDKQIFAGGMFMYEGTCFNSLFANNYSTGSAGGIGFCVGRFYNNTIAYNTCKLVESGEINGGAISLATESNPNLFVANTIIYGNNGRAIRQRGQTDLKLVNPFIHCYIQSEIPLTENLYLKNIINHSDNSSSFGIGNTFYNGESPSAANTPFEADVDEDGNYTGGASIHDDFRLWTSNTHLINMGTEDFGGKVYESLVYKNYSEKDIKKDGSVYNSVKDVVIPDNDVAFTERVKDCQVDIGAYEYDGTKAIEPMLFPDTKEAVFYVTQNGAGMATATNPANAACYLKFQKVLDAAGRWRYASYFYANDDEERKGEVGYNYNLTNFTTAVLTSELEAAKTRAEDAGGTLDVEDELPRLKDYRVVIKLEGDNGTHFSYIPTRTSRTSDNENPNDLEMSLIVPHGVQIEGGYEDQFYKDRDPLGRPTLFNGEIYNSTLNVTGNVYHVVTFTNDLFDVNERLYLNGTEQMQGQLAFLSDADSYMSGTPTDAEKTAWVNGNRTVLDGLFIANGYANGVTDEEKRGAGAVVTAFAHVRNCIIQNNHATGAGGGLYLEPAALVSGCIVKNNHAYIGGGLYVQDPVGSTPSADTYVRLITSTVIGNTAETTAGGLWFDMNLRANSSAFWLNRANDLNNIAGMLNTDETQIVDNYPLNYCGVESRRVNGVNNIELPVAEGEGVRWDHSEAHEVEIHNLLGGSDVAYYPITLSSVLGRAGMTYAAYEEMRAIYPTLELSDVAGLNRMVQPEDEVITLAMLDGEGNSVTLTKVQKDNAFIEMGARVLNGTFELKVELSHIMTRLFVTTTEDLPSEAALSMQQNTVGDEMVRRGVSYVEGSEEYIRLRNNVEMYRQMGSSFLNPFHRFGDALEYIIRVRKSKQDYVDENGEYVLNGSGDRLTVGDVYKDVRFEVFSGGGTFYPFRDAHGKQGEARANTFVVPEEVTIVGGVDATASGHAYCQETSGSLSMAGYDFDCLPTEAIREARTRMDRNGNRVKEPWEMEHQTILSGNAVNIDSRTNVYHVITCFSDEEQVGELPTRKNDEDEELPALLMGLNLTTRQRLQNLEAESSASRDKRTIFIDGVTITGGHANDLEDGDAADNFQKLTYFRGGGIFIDGNWDNSFNSSVDLPEVLSVARRDITMITANCLFQDNLAGNGGGIYTNGTYYAFSCHFTKNTARGPNTLVDQQYIPWTAGGAIANNYSVNVWNSLFDNNEAKRGDLPIQVGAITNADARQGYAGVISCSETGLLRIANCDFVRNKAVAFPALYNFIDNNIRALSSSYREADPDNEDMANQHYFGAGHHFAVNSIFWGNEATATTIAPANEIEEHYYTTPIHHNPPMTTDDLGRLIGDLRKPWHVANFGPLMDIATLTFCSYEDGTGREGTVWHDNHDYAKTARIESLEDLYKGDFIGVLNDYFGWYPDGDPQNPYFRWYKPSTDEYVDSPTDMEIASGTVVKRPRALEPGEAGIPYNYNLVLNRENTAEDGPFFVQPSITAGADGYMETADWLVARLNPTIDTGWGYLKQKVATEDIHTGMLSTVFTKDAAGTIPADAEDNQYTDLYGDGFYNLHSKNIHERFADVGFSNLLPIGDEKYMEYVHEGEGEGRNMRRISTHPKIGIQDVFIDMGIYEYQYVQLITGGDEIDVIWVAETEEQGETCDGSTWRKATSDLQNAIETLLLSLNDHDKVIKMRGGTYRPLKMTSGNQKTFYIATPDKNDGVITPSGLQMADQTIVARSLTFYGGYTNEPLPDYADGEETRDPVANPVVFKMTKEEGNTDHQLAHLFIIEDAEVKGNFANYLTQRNKDFKDYVMPIVFDGLTFVNPYGLSGSGGDDDYGGADIYYRTQYQTVGDNVETYHKDESRLLKASTDGSGNPVPKLIIRNCVFANSGIDKNCSAVKIQKGGGQTLVYNTLFHSNSGAPIEAVNTEVVNCTFALNGGHATLTEATENYFDGSSGNFPSGIHNSIIWKDDLAETDPTKRVQWDSSCLNLSSGNMTHNAYTQWNQSTEEWDEPDGNTVSDAQGNFLLSTVNTDVLLGPNFIDPKEVITATDPDEREAEILSRNFHVNPSAHILNRADKDTYVSRVPYHAYFPDYAANEPISIYNATTNPSGKDEEGSTQYARLRAVRDEDGNITSTYWFHSAQHSDPTTLSDAQLKGTDEKYTEPELAFKARLMGAGIERGAYECTAAVERVLYVMDGAPGENDGTTWKDAFGIDQLQTAIDVASVYSLTTSPRERAYVFVRATDVPADVVKLRDGVSVYGSLSPLFGEEVERETDGSYTDDNIKLYINKVRANRDGVATRDATHNTVRGLVSDNNATHTSGFLLDGFWLSAGGETATTPFDIDKENTVLRNAVVTGNTVTASGLPVVNMAKGLLYNTLVYGNTPGSTAPEVSVGSDGYVLNCTVVARGEGVAALGGANGADADHVQNTIGVNEYGGPAPMFAPYLRTGANAYVPAAFLTNHVPYWYQLHEYSRHIDAGDDDNGTGDGSTVRDGGNTIAKRFPHYVDFSLDRDALGNPRRLADRIDDGCFETWRVSDNRLATNETNVVEEGESGYYDNYTQNYGGHRYPHVGSVLYVMDGANLVFKVDDGQHPLFTGAIQPGYVLLRPGGSIYGQGNPLQFAYVAVDRAFLAGTEYTLQALPYSHDYLNAVQTSYNPPTDRLTETSYAPNIVGGYAYNSASRARWNSIYRSDNSLHWSTLTGISRTRAANEGYLLRFASPMEDAQEVRFTGWAASAGLFIYEEDGSDKTVTLTQYDEHPTDRSAHFTHLEDMGWNLKGMPYLISNYRTDVKHDGKYQVNVPHLFYDMAPDGTYDCADKATGLFYTKRSWDSGVSLSPGEGYFTQTAVIGPSEMLTFRLPSYDGAPTLAARPRLLTVDLTNDRAGTDRVQLTATSPQATMDYQIGRDGAKWMPLSATAPTVWLKNAAGTPFSLSADAPTEQLLPLGVLTPVAGAYTFALHDEADAESPSVWLVDRQLNTVTDLTRESYTFVQEAAATRSATNGEVLETSSLSPDEGTEPYGRFFLQVGGTAPRLQDAAPAQRLRVYVRRHVLHVENLQEGDRIIVYTAGGVLLVNQTASDAHWQTLLPTDGTYLVHVANETYKVLAR